MLNGQLNDDLNARGGKITINGTIQGLSTLVAQDIVIKENASFFGNVRFWNQDSPLDTGEKSNQLAYLAAGFDSLCDFCRTKIIFLYPHNWVAYHVDRCYIFLWCYLKKFLAGKPHTDKSSLNN